MRPQGGILGATVTPTTTAASGVWTLREAERFRQGNTWPKPFEPSDLSGLQLWLDASYANSLYDATSGGSLVEADGSVARWEDRSGNGRHATQSTTGSRPLRKASVQGGRDTLRFDGSDDSLAIASSTATFKFLHDGDSTVFFVAKPGFSAGSNSLGVIVSTGPGSLTGVSNSPGFVAFYNDAGANTDMLDVIIETTGDNQVARDRIDNIFPVNEFAVFSITCDPTNATQNNRVKIRKNGGAESSVSLAGTYYSATSNNAAADLTIAQSSASTQFLNGDIAEVVMYDVALSDADRSSVENYLKEKWNI